MPCVYHGGGATKGSDSKAALYRLESNRNKSREDIAIDISIVAHHLVARGVELHLQWVPAHVDIPGNEMADQAAKKGAQGIDATTLNVPPAYHELKSKVVARAWTVWSEEFHVTAQSRDWETNHELPKPGGYLFPEIPVHLARLMHRIRSGHWRSIFLPVRCVCWDFVSFYHALFKCTVQQSHFKPVVDLLGAKSMALSMDSIVRDRSSLTLAANLLFTSEVAAYL